LSISSDKLTLMKNNETIETYTFDGDTLPDDEGDEDAEDHAADDPYEKLEKDSERLGSIIDGGGDVEGGGGGDDVEEGVGVDAHIELEFVDDGGDGDVDAGELDADEDEDAEVHIQPTFKIKSFEHRMDNSIPENMVECNVDLGLLYFSMDLSIFYQRLRTEGPPLEEEVLTAYDTMDDNEADTRSSKLDEIQELCSKISSKAKQLVEGYQKRELDLKSQVLKLSTVLEKAEKLKDKVVDKKFADEKPNVDRLYNQTKTSLYDLNVEIAQNKDCINDLLNIYISSLTYLSTDDI
jgi:hypothetical protein